jgi:uncharacterized protein YbjT (DUF2867 family)
MSFLWNGFPSRVLVTGAGGNPLKSHTSTGTILVRKLLEHGKDNFITRAFVRSQESENQLRDSIGDLEKGLTIVRGDITKHGSLTYAFQGIDALVICTGSFPQLDYSSLPAVLLTKLFSLGFYSKRPRYYFADGGYPQDVDWMGTCKQIEAAKASGVRYIVLASCMGGTKPDHFLNASLDNFVLWKRKAECYLMSCGIDYTIIHTGTLLPIDGYTTLASGGGHKLYAGIDDSLLEDERKVSTIYREDLAEVCFQCLLRPEARNRSFDLGSAAGNGHDQEERHIVDLRNLLAPLCGKNCAYTQADADFKPPPASRGFACGVCTDKT